MDGRFYTQKPQKYAYTNPFGYVAYFIKKSILCPQNDSYLASRLHTAVPMCQHGTLYLEKPLIAVFVSHNNSP